MLGALVLRILLRRSQAATVQAQDVNALRRYWAEDITLTFMGQPPLVGREAVEDWYRAWFAGVADVFEQPISFALAHPFALGLTNTVLFETTSETVLPDGRTAVLHETTAIDLERGKVRAVRVYVADPQGEKALLGLDQS